MRHLIMIFTGIFVMAGAAAGVPIDHEKMSEDILTMSRLIDGELQKNFAGKYSMGLWNLGCMGVYLKDYGIVFSTRVQFPIFDYREVKSEKEKEPDDLWETYRKRSQLIIQTHSGSSTELRKSNLDYEKNQAEEINKLERFLTDIICKYAHNIDQLSSDEYITIAVQGSKSFDPSVNLIAEDVKMIKRAEQKLQNVYTVLGNRFHGSVGRCLIMRIKKKDLGKECADKIEISFH